MNLTKQLKGKALNIVDRLVPVRPVARTSDEQNQLDRESRRMHLYFCRTCASSITVKRQCEKLGLRVVEKDVMRVNAYRNELVHGGGAPKVPCLRVDNGQSEEWLYSSDAILDYLKNRF
ncbi:MAG: glutathione S-transferase N-terminal domain-containing protein [Pseudomonadota bacterium]|nr:glutathione S-transferase N-terminal domain-containing protein [Pseudomonadota bacterium]